VPPQSSRVCFLSGLPVDGTEPRDRCFSWSKQPKPLGAQAAEQPEASSQAWASKRPWSPSPKSPRSDFLRNRFCRLADTTHKNDPHFSTDVPLLARAPRL